MRIVLLSFILLTVFGLIPTQGNATNQTADRLILDGSIFEPESTILKKSAIPSLQPLLNELTSDPSLRLSIESHVDATGSPDKDLLLTRDRSWVINNWFVAQGVEPGRITPVGYGSTRPRLETATKEKTPLKHTRIEIVKARGGYPVAVFSSTQHQFEEVVDGVEVLHDYVVRNTGTAELLIREVKTG